jgi:ribonucleotide monophosphatase NagD (HAD superfamily)
MNPPKSHLPSQLYDAYIFDLDGTVYLGDALLPTAGETLTHLREMGKRTVFLSNNPTHTRYDYAAKLTRLGLPTPAEDIITPAEGAPLCRGGRAAASRTARRRV